MPFYQSVVIKAILRFGGRIKIATPQYLIVLGLFQVQRTCKFVELNIQNSIRVQRTRTLLMRFMCESAGLEKN